MTRPAALLALALVLPLASCDRREVRRTHYGDGSPWSEVRYRDGKPDGTWRTWWENGRLKSEGAYEDGELHGRWRTWFEDGAPQTEQFFAHGEPQLTWTHWYQNGEIVTRGEFKDGVKDGVWEEWYGDGTLKAHAEFTKGINSGQAELYDTAGRMTSRTTYGDDGRPKYLELWDAGTGSRAEGPIVNDQWDGEWKAYGPNGELIEAVSGMYVEGKLQKDAPADGE